MLLIFQQIFNNLRSVYNIVASWYGFSFVFICSVISFTVVIVRRLNGNDR